MQRFTNNSLIKKTGIFFLFFFLYCHPFLFAQKSQFCWPLDIKPALTSTFAEFRKGWHLHAGIDLKTWGKKGYKVFAIDNGYLYRILVSPFGYGKAVYLKL